MELTKLPVSFTTEAVASVVGQIASAVEDGNLYAGEAYAYAKTLEEVAKGIRKNVPATAWQGRGATIAVSSMPKYDYSNTSAWQALESQIAELREVQKQIEAEAQRIYKAGKAKGAVLTEEGEAYEVLCPTVTHSERVTVSLSKK